MYTVSQQIPTDRACWIAYVCMHVCMYERTYCGSSLPLLTCCPGRRPSLAYYLPKPNQPEYGQTKTIPDTSQTHRQRDLARAGQNKYLHA